MKLKAPFPWFGGKSRVAHIVWERFGNVPNYVEPFFGSGAVLLGRPHHPKNETVNDLDCYLANFWRAVREDPDGVAAAADRPVNEADLHAEHHWLHAQKEFREKMHTERDFFDTEVAGIWVWGISAWIGDAWCRIKTAGSMPDLMGRKGIHSISNLDNTRPNLGTGTGIFAKRPQLKKGGAGVHAQRAQARAPGDERKMPQFKGDRGIVREHKTGLYEYMQNLCDRMRRVRVCCGEWHRVLGPSPTVHVGTTAVFLDPPYGVDDRDKVYNHDSKTLAADVETWCVEHGEDNRLRIALCGYEGEHNALEDLGWECVPWKAAGGYARGKAKENAYRERIWFSPHCLQVGLFGFA